MSLVCAGWMMSSLAALGAGQDAASAIGAERRSEVARVLASDALEGRSMGTPGEERTVAYLIEQFKAAGLEPGGENGGWTQAGPLIRTRLQRSQGERG